MIDNVTTFVFLAVLSAAGAAILVWQSRRIVRRDALRRRLGELKQESDHLWTGGDDEARFGDSVRRLLIESGLDWTFGQFVSRTVLASAIGLLLGFMVGGGFLGVMLGVVGGMVMLIVVKAARSQRLKKCDEQMPQALEIMALALRAGHALPSALALAAEETPMPLAAELRRASDENALGKPLGEVLESFGARLPDCEAVNTFVVAVLVLQETGGNLISVIDRIVENARARSNYLARLRALTSEGRSSAKLLAALPGAFAVLAAASDPSYADFLLGDPSGRVVGLVAFGLWMAGILWTRRLVRALT